MGEFHPALSCPQSYETREFLSRCRLFRSQHSSRRGANRSSGRDNRQGCTRTPEVLRSRPRLLDRKSTRLNSSHVKISYAVFCLKKKKIYDRTVKDAELSL